MKMPSLRLYWKTIVSSLVIAFFAGLLLQFIAWKFGAPTGPFPRGASVPEFSLAPIGGGADHPFPDLVAGRKIVILNFWATWCAPCVKEIPSLVELERRYSDRGVKVLFLSVDENAQDVVPLALTRFKIDFTTYFDRDQKLSEIFGVTGLPKSYIFDHQGQVLDVVVGDRDWVSPEFLKLLEGWLG